MLLNGIDSKLKETKSQDDEYNYGSLEQFLIFIDEINIKCRRHQVIIRAKWKTPNTSQYETYRLHEIRNSFASRCHVKIGSISFIFISARNFRFSPKYTFMYIYSIYSAPMLNSLSNIKLKLFQSNIQDSEMLLSKCSKPAFIFRWNHVQISTWCMCSNMSVRSV